MEPLRKGRQKPARNLFGWARPPGMYTGHKQGEGAKLRLCPQSSGLGEAVPNSAQLLSTKMSIYRLTIFLQAPDV